MSFFVNKNGELTTPGIEAVNKGPELRFVFLPRISERWGKFLWFTYAYRVAVRAFRPIGNTGIDHEYLVYRWYSQKEYVWLKLKGEI